MYYILNHNVQNCAFVVPYMIIVTFSETFNKHFLTNNIFSESGPYLCFWLYVFIQTTKRYFQNIFILIKYV